MCEQERKKKKKKERFFFSRETYTRIIVIELRIMKLIQSLSRSFLPLRGKGFPRKFCVPILDY